MLIIELRIIIFISWPMKIKRIIIPAANSNNHQSLSFLITIKQNWYVWYEQITVEFFFCCCNLVATSYFKRIPHASPFIISLRKNALNNKHGTFLATKADTISIYPIAAAMWDPFELFLSIPRQLKLMKPFVVCCYDVLLQKMIDLRVVRFCAKLHQCIRFYGYF